MLLDKSNWWEAFDAATRDGVDPVPPGSAVSTSPFTIDDVKRVVAMVDGENDGDEWAGVFELHDGRFAALSAWCDYTGWG